METAQTVKAPVSNRWGNLKTSLLHFSYRVCLQEVGNHFIRPEDTDVIANISSFERTEAATKKFQPFKAPGPNELYPLLLRNSWNRPSATGGHSGAVPPQMTACTPPNEKLCPPELGLCREDINRLGATGVQMEA